jgi:hypothetical protein
MVVLISVRETGLYQVRLMAQAASGPEMDGEENREQAFLPAGPGGFPAASSFGARDRKVR